MKKLLILFILLFPLSAHSNSIEAAKSVMKQTTINKKCKYFWEYYMFFVKQDDYSSPEAMILLLDEESPGLVDICNAKRHEYIK